MPLSELTLRDHDDLLPKNGVAVIDFWAAWCRPCSQFAPVFERVSQSFPDAVFLKVNTDREQELARLYHVQSLPTVVITINRNVVMRRAGVMTARELKSVVTQYMALSETLPNVP